MDGQVAINHCAEAVNGRGAFVKHHVDADLVSEEEVIAQTKLADDHSVRVTAVIPSTTAKSRRYGTAHSIGQWMPGHTVEDGSACWFMVPVRLGTRGRPVGLAGTVSVPLG